MTLGGKANKIFSLFVSYNRLIISLSFGALILNFTADSILSTMVLTSSSLISQKVTLYFNGTKLGFQTAEKCFESRHKSQTLERISKTYLQPVPYFLPILALPMDQVAAEAVCYFSFQYFQYSHLFLSYPRIWESLKLYLLVCQHLNLLHLRKNMLINECIENFFQDSSI